MAVRKVEGDTFRGYRRVIAPMMLMLKLHWYNLLWMMELYNSFSHQPHHNTLTWPDVVY